MFGLSHRNYRDNLNAYIDGQLSPRDRARLEQHLQQCPECRWELETLQRTVALVRQMPAVRAPRSFQLPVQAPRATPWLLRPWVYGATRVATVAAMLVFAVSLAGNVIVPDVGLRNAASASPERGMVALAATLPAQASSQAKSAGGTPAGYQTPPEQPAATAGAAESVRAAATPTAQTTAALGGAAASATPGAKSATPQPTQVATSTRAAPMVAATVTSIPPQPTLDLFGSLSQGETTAATPEVRAQTAIVTATAATTPVPAPASTVKLEPSPTATALPTVKPTQTAVPTQTGKATVAPTATVAATRQADTAIAMAPGPVATTDDGQKAAAGVSTDATGSPVVRAAEHDPAGDTARAVRLFAQATEGWPWAQLALASGSLLALLVVVLLWIKAMRARLS